MRIPLPAILRRWRERAYDAHVTPPAERFGVGAWAWLAKHPALYRLGARTAAWALSLMGGRRGRIPSLPLAGAWTKTRDLPAPAGRTFHDEWRRRRGRST